MWSGTVKERSESPVYRRIFGATCVFVNKFLYLKHARQCYKTHIILFKTVGHFKSMIYSVYITLFVPAAHPIS